MSENELAQSVNRFFQLLTTLELKAHITGGLASSYYGEPRYTQDIDIVVDPVSLKNGTDRFLKLLGSDYFYSVETIKSSILSGRVFQVIDDSTGFKFDIYPREGVPGELSRSQMVELFTGVNLPILSITDCVISKLKWVEKGSSKSTMDIRGIFSRLTQEQAAEISGTAEQAGLAELLISILGEAHQEPS